MRFVWPERVLCDNEVCPTTANGVPLFFDHDHLTVAAAQQTSSLYDFMFDPIVEENGPK